MIFSGNTTALGATNIAIDETYNTPYGANLALVESARNDMSMFMAMIKSDYKEMAICQESTGVVMEGEISALHEAVGGGIFKKIAELFKKLIAKIKSIFHNFMARINVLTKDAKTMVKKYKKELNMKSNLDKLEVKWRKIDSKYSNSVLEFNLGADFNANEAVSKHSDEHSERIKAYMTDVTEDSIEDYKKEKISKVLDTPETMTLKEACGGIGPVMTWLENYDSKLKTMNSNITKAETKLGKIVSYYSKKVDTVAGIKDTDKKYSGTDAYGNKEEIDNVNQGTVDTAKKQYEMAQAYNEVMMADIAICQECTKNVYKQYKAALVKAITANDKKLAESTLLDAVAEAAEYEVDEIINNASDKEIASLSAADKKVLDSDVSDDPDKLTYGPDCYTANASWNDSCGTVDTKIGDGKVEESAYFGQMFY